MGKGIWGIFGLLVGCVLGIAIFVLISSIVVDSAERSVSMATNLIVALGTVFTLGFAVWQHQQTIDRERGKSDPRICLLGAPFIESQNNGTTGCVTHKIQFQLENIGGGAAKSIHFRIAAGISGEPSQTGIIKDERFESLLMEKQGFHFNLPIEFNTLLPAKGNEIFLFMRLDFKGTSAHSDALHTNYYMKANYEDTCLAYAMESEVKEFKESVEKLFGS